MDDDFVLAAGKEMLKRLEILGRGPFLRVGQEKEFGNQGLKKKLLKEGEGWETPHNGDEVEVHYTGTLLDGTQFDSSGDGDTPFVFILGQGQVIEGWDIGIKTMKKGENALFTIPAKLAYGVSGSPPTIPPNATLQLDVELLSWTSVMDVCQDGGVVKRILVKGDMWMTPKDCEEVLVKYEAQLEDGTVVAKSDGVEFTLKEGHFCPALSKAVETMKKGEKALLIVKPQYGFGENGKPASGTDGAVPPNAALEITLELVSWKAVSNVTGDQKVMKKILKEGKGYDEPNEGAIVQVKLIGKLQDGTVFLEEGHDNENEVLEFKTFEEEVIDGVDRAVITMKKGEVALVTIEPEYAYGSSESKQELAVVPPNSIVYFEIELVSFINEKESLDMNDQAKLETASKNKEEGDALFKEGKYSRASKRYEKAVKCMKYDFSFNDEEKKLVKALKVACSLNNAECKLKLKLYKEAEKLCYYVLDEDSRNVKALHMRAQAHIELEDLILAEYDLKRALEIDPDNREVKQEYENVKEKKRELNEKKAKLYGNNLFWRMANLGYFDSDETERTTIIGSKA